MTFTVRKYGATVPVTRDVLIDHGLLKPTAEEQARLDAWRVDYERRKQAATEAWPGFVEALAAITDPVGRAVLDMHRSDSGWCAGCDGSDGYGEGAVWPCGTTEVVAKALGIPVPEDLDMAEQARS